MRILHTSDWHLGHTLHGLSREFEHQCFLSWLVEVLTRERVDVLLVCGDVFDTANPGARASQAYFGFLAAAQAALPRLQIVVIAGNHDSAQRLQAPREILARMRVYVVGEPRGPDGELQLEDMVVPLHDRGGSIGGWCAAVPFLRPSDLDAVDESRGDTLIEGVRQLYGEVLDVARTKRQDGQALIATGHCYMVGTALCELSERRVLGGNQHALPADIFPDDVDYAALGHLHKAQRVGGREHVRYCGAPLPLSLGEGRNRHQVCLVDMVDGRCAEVRPIPVPRAVDVIRLPKEGSLPLDGILERIDGLPRSDEFQDPRRCPYLELRVLLDQPVPDLRAQIEERMAGRGPRLARLTVEYPGEVRSLADGTAQVLRDLTPEEVFRSLYSSRHGGQVPDDLLAAFHELVDEVGQKGGGG